MSKARTKMRIDCQQTADFFEKLMSVCRAMIPNEVPEHVLRCAHSIWLDGMRVRSDFDVLAEATGSHRIERWRDCLKSYT